MRIRGQWWNLQEEADDGTQGGAGSGAAGSDGWVAVPDAGSDENAGDAGAGTQPGSGTDESGAKTPEGQPKDMLEAITQGLAKVDQQTKETPAAAKPKKDEGAAAAEEKHPNGAPKKNEKGEDLDAEGKVVPKKSKTAAELELKPDELKTLGPKAQERFREVISTLKEREATIGQLTETNKTLASARDNIVSVLEETHTTSDQLSAYLEFNRMLQSGDPKDLESALELLENQRAAIYKSLGREPEDGGLDLLAEFPDLKEDVSEAKITRERALEIAQARRERAAAQARDERTRSSEQSAQATQQARTKALNDIGAWTAKMAKEDIDFKAKEAKLLDQVDDVIKNYAPNQWVATLQMLYKQIAIPKAASQPRKGEQPLRPSGAKPGAKAPQNMFEAMWGQEAPK